LLQEWDPIGIGDDPDAANEYDAYAGQVFSSLQGGGTAASIRDYLDWVEAEQMGLSVRSRRTEEVAGKIASLHSGKKDRTQP
jgi:hypothetical protein